MISWPPSRKAQWLISLREPQSLHQQVAPLAGSETLVFSASLGPVNRVQCETRKFLGNAICSIHDGSLFTS